MTLSLAAMQGTHLLRASGSDRTASLCLGEHLPVCFPNTIQGSAPWNLSNSVQVESSFFFSSHPPQLFSWCLITLLHLTVVHLFFFPPTSLKTTGRVGLRFDYSPGICQKIWVIASSQEKEFDWYNDTFHSHSGFPGYQEHTLILILLRLKKK